MIRTYALFLCALVLVVAGVAWFSPGAALIAAGVGVGFLWWDSAEVDQ